MPDGESSFDYYAKYRHKGSPEDAVDELGAALGEALDKLAAQSRERAESAGSPSEADFLRHTASAGQALADRVRGLAGTIAEGNDATAANVAMSTVANVAMDLQFPAVVRAAGGPGDVMATEAMPESSWRFDWDTFFEWLPDMAEKMGALGAATGNPILSGIGALLWDVTLLGKIFTYDPNAPKKGNAPGGAGTPTTGPAGGGGSVLDGIKSKLDDIASDLAKLSDSSRATKKEVDNIESKADTLAAELGKTLVGEPWSVHPMSTSTPRNKIPAVSLKDEMHQMEDLLGELFRVFTGGTHAPGGTPGVPPGVPPGGGPPPGPWPPDGPFIYEPPDPPLYPPDDDPPYVPRLDPRLKKIYVYQEGVLEARSANDERVVHVRTDAFDLSGFLDLTSMRSGDEFTVDLMVSVAGRPHQLFDRGVFADAGVKTFADFARGENYVSARDVKIVMRQTRSEDDYATPVPVAYQFVVESR